MVQVAERMRLNGEASFVGTELMVAYPEAQFAVPVATGSSGCSRHTRMPALRVVECRLLPSCAHGCRPVVSKP